MKPAVEDEGVAQGVRCRPHYRSRMLARNGRFFECRGCGQTYSEAQVAEAQRELAEEIRLNGPTPYLVLE